MSPRSFSDSRHAMDGNVCGTVGQTRPIDGLKRTLLLCDVFHYSIVSQNCRRVCLYVVVILIVVMSGSKILYSPIWGVTVYRGGGWRGLAGHGVFPPPLSLSSSGSLQFTIGGLASSNLAKGGGGLNNLSGPQRTHTHTSPPMIAPTLSDQSLLPPLPRTSHLLLLNNWCCFKLKEACAHVCVCMCACVRAFRRVKEVSGRFIVNWRRNIVTTLRLSSTK